MRYIPGSTMLLFLLLSAMILESWAVSGQCDRTSSLKFSVSSWKNESGNRLVAADVQSDVSDNNNVSLTVELFSEKCGDTRAVILKTLCSSGHPEEQDTISTTVAPTVVPLPGYRHFPGYGYYKRLPNRMNWADGVEACRKEGTRMLLVESQEELETVFDWTPCCPWVGVHRESSSGPWINILGQVMNSTDFFGWLPGYPVGRGDCVILNSLSDRKGTTDRKCYTSYQVVCEQIS